MNYISTNAVVLKRINYGEADRIITVLTKDKGKLTLMAKGVRKSTSKLAGGIELFSESQIQFIKGRGGMGTLISARIINNYPKISLNLKSINVAYEAIMLISKITEHSPDSDVYYQLLKDTLYMLDRGIKENVVAGSLYAKILDHSGHHLNFNSDVDGNKLIEQEVYQYSFEKSGFEVSKHGLNGTTVKVAKLLFIEPPIRLNNISGMSDDLDKAIALLKLLTEYYLQIKVNS